MQHKLQQAGFNPVYNPRLRTLSEARVEAMVLLVCQRFSGVANAVQVWCGQEWVEVAGRSDVGRTLR